MITKTRAVIMHPTRVLVSIAKDVKDVKVVKYLW